MSFRCVGVWVSRRGRGALSHPRLFLNQLGAGSPPGSSQDLATPGQSTGLPHFTFDRVQTHSPLKVTVAENMETKMLVEKVVQLINEGVTGMDLLEVFLSRRIQPLQARDHPMWLYSGDDDTARVHPEEVPTKTVAQWLRGITGNKDNPRGARRVNPFNDSNQPDKVWPLHLIEFGCVF